MTKLEDNAIGTHKIVTLSDGLKIIALAQAFDKATHVLVSKDGETFILHEADAFMKLVDSGSPIKVG